MRSSPDLRDIHARPHRGAWAILTALALLSLTAVGGCAGRTPAPASISATVTAEEILTVLRSRGQQLQTIKGLFRAQIQGPGIPFPQRFEGALFFRRPDSYRVRGFSRLGGDVFELSLARDRYRLRLPGAGRLYAGQAEQLGQMGPVGEPFRLTVLGLNGLLGDAAIPDDARVVLQIEEQRYRLDVLGPEQSHEGPMRRLWIEAGTFHIVQEDQLAPDGSVLASARFEDFKPLSRLEASISTAGPEAEIIRAHRITVQDGKAGAMVTLTFQELTANPALKPEELQVAGVM
jgi:hypothetical protein